jgi:hypothetical protein
LIAIPVLAGSSAYALAEALNWPIGLERKLHKAKGFYGILFVSTLLGVALNFTAINPIKGAFLERRGQRRGRRSNHDRDDADDDQQETHRLAPITSPAEDYRMGRHLN